LNHPQVNIFIKNKTLLKVSTTTRICLTGFMGSGKSTVGKKLAHRLNYHFVDLDDAITDFTAQSITDLFNVKGEEVFRRIESQILEEVLNDSKNSVISLGGGTVCFGTNLSLIKSKAILVYLELPPKALFNRLVNAKSSRPLLANLSDNELELYIQTKLSERESFYKQAHFTINGLSLNVDDILRTINCQV